MTDHAIPAVNNRRTLKLALAAVALVAAGGAVGTVASHALQPSIEMAPLRPVAIKSLPSASGIVTVRGRVAEVYGNKFVMDDGTARALVDTGREGEGGTLVGIGAPVTVQGRFDRGFVHASFLVDQVGKVTALDRGPPHDRPVPPHGNDRGPPARGDMGPPAPAGDQAPPPPAGDQAPPAPAGNQAPPPPAAG